MTRPLVRKWRGVSMIKIGIIGGSGLDNPDILTGASDIEVATAI
jgi:purine nucleoside phosphorylase